MNPTKNWSKQSIFFFQLSPFTTFAAYLLYTYREKLNMYVKAKLNTTVISKGGWELNINILQGEY